MTFQENKMVQVTLRAPELITAGATGVSLPRKVLRGEKQIATLTYPSSYGIMRLEYEGGSKVFTSEIKALRWAADWIK